MSSSLKKYDRLTDLRDFSPQAIAEESHRRMEAIKTKFEGEFMPRVAQAKAEGITEGKRLGEESAKALIQPVLQTLSQAVQASVEAKNQHLIQLETLGLDLLAMYLPQLVGSLAAQAPQTLMQETLRKVLHNLDGPHQPTLFVATDVESTTRTLCQTPEFADTLGTLVIKADSHIKPGDCRMAWHNHGHEINLGRALQEVIQELQGQAATSPTPTPTLEIAEIPPKPEG